MGKGIGRVEAVYGRADHQLPEAGRGGRSGEGTMPAARVLGGELLPVAQQVRRDGCVGREEAAGAGGGERAAEEGACRIDARERGDA